MHMNCDLDINKRPNKGLKTIQNPSASRATAHLPAVAIRWSRDSTSLAAGRHTSFSSTDFRGGPLYVNGRRAHAVAEQVAAVVGRRMNSRFSGFAF